MTWKDALRQAQQQPVFTDRLKRRCQELQNLTLTFTQDYEKPLNEVRALGWLYPSDEELASIMLHEHDQHLYTYSKHIHEQLPYVTKLLQENPNTRRAIIHLTDMQESKQHQHLPCMITVYAAIREEQLHLTTYARSIDLLIGLPANLYQSYVLAQAISKELNTPLGSISFLINSAHIFKDYQKELHTILDA